MESIERARTHAQEVIATEVIRDAPQKISGRASLRCSPARRSRSRARSNPNLNRPDVRVGDRVDGATFASRSAVWGVHGAAATSHPLATLAAIDILKAGGSAVDAAIAANACLGFLEPTANGIGGDCFAMLWDPKTRKVVGLNGSGRSPANLTLDTVRSRAKNGLLPAYGAISVSVPGAVDAWWQLHQRYGKLPWKSLFAPAIALRRQKARRLRRPWRTTSTRASGTSPRPDSGIEEIENFRKIWAPRGQARRAKAKCSATPRSPARFGLIAEGGRDAFYKGEIAETIERYFKRIGGWMTKADLAAHASEWTQPIVTDYRGVEVYGLAPNTQGLSHAADPEHHGDVRLRRRWASSPPRSIHHGVEAKRLAFEDRARFFADPDFSKTPIEWLNSKEYARERAKLIRPDRILTPVHPGAGAEPRRHHLFLHGGQRRHDGVDDPVELPRHGSGLMADGLGFMFQNRGQLFALDGRASECLCAGQAAVPHHHPGLRAEGRRAVARVRRDGRRHAAAGAGAGDLEHGGLRPRRAGSGRCAALASRRLHRADRRSAAGRRLLRVGDRRPRGNAEGARRTRLEARRKRWRLRAAIRPSSAGPAATPPPRTCARTALALAY